MNMEAEYEEEWHLEKMRDLMLQLQGLRQCYNVMRKHGAAIQRALTAFELSSENSNNTELTKSRKISENCVLFGVTAHALMNNCDNFLNAVQTELTAVYNIMKIQKMKIENLEKTLRDGNGYSNMKSVSFAKDFSKVQSESEFRDSGTTMTSEDEMQVDNIKYLRQTVRSNTLHADVRAKDRSQARTEVNENNDIIVDVSDENERIRRSVVPERPNIHFSAWNFIKNIIGKDLYKIAVPVNFNEPLTLLQRLTEEFEYWNLLDEAAEIDDKYRQLAYVAAFSISVYACNDFRTGKPFNPLLGETYECDRTKDKGWRSICEQVSHHPPTSVLYCEGRGWIFWQDVTLSSKFKGKSLLVESTGSSNCKFLKTGNTFSWNKVPTIVKNIIVGTMWLDHFGQVDIIGLDAANGICCELTYEAYSLFSSSRQRFVHGIIKDENDIGQYLIKGYWDLQIEIAPVLSFQKTAREPQYETGEYVHIWTRINFEHRTESNYYFSNFTCELNENEEGVAPTDSRLRPDVRLMEQGLWDQSNAEKLRLEENQRTRRKTRLEGKHNEDEEGEPLWFSREMENGKARYKYKHTYWDAKLQQDWSQCPNIF